MSIWLILPSARPVEEAEACLKLWSDKSYRIGVFREQARGRVGADLLINDKPYPGYAAAVNLLAKKVLDLDPSATWMIASGDDTDPDPHDPQEIAQECLDHFYGRFGVMQPTGDTWNCSPTYSDRPTIERVAGSPWLGRQWCRSAYGGRGPLWPEYYHNFADEDLQHVATKLGVFWQRSDLIHLHHNWARAETIEERVRIAVQGPPEHLIAANAHWTADEKLFFARRDAGFPGSDPS